MKKKYLILAFSDITSSNVVYRKIINLIFIGKKKC